jgi:hypothetical protein
LVLKSAAPNSRPFTARTLVVAQQQILLAELLQHHFNLVVLELDDLLLAFVSSVNEGGKQNVVGLEHERHWKLGRGQAAAQISQRCL